MPAIKLQDVKVDLSMRNLHIDIKGNLFAKIGNFAIDYVKGILKRLI